MKNYKAIQPKDIKIIANIMDQKFSAPGGIKFGLDSIIGLIPGIGDSIGTIISMYLLVRGYSLGCSAAVLKKISINILIDHGIGMIPILGDIFDIFWKANTKNTALIYAHLEGRELEDHSSKKVLIILVSAVLILFISTIYISVYLLSMILN